ncbi:MAG: hypothetical protein ACOC9R_05075 [bacterium]
MTEPTVLVAYVHPATEIQHSFTVSLMNLVNYDAAHDQRLFGEVGGPLMMRAGTSGVPQARIEIFRHWLDRTGDEWLWMVDTDMGFAPDTVDRLLEAADPVERPVVGALCFGLRQAEPDGYGGYVTYPFPTMYGWGEDDNGNVGFQAAVQYPRDELVRVSGTGAACLLVHRSAAEKMRAEYGDDWFAPVRYPDGRFVSEDLSFCYRLGALDIPLHVHTGVRTTHAKIVWIGEQDFLAHRTLSQAVAATEPAAEAAEG